MLDVIVNENTDFFEHRDWISQYDEIESMCVVSPEVKTDKKYTIAIPTYKRPKLLKEAVDSILSQRNIDCNLFDIVVVDNNSERGDETEIMLREAHIPNLTYYKNKKNIGAGGNVNRCLTLSKGEWVIILHSDDILSPFFMKEMVSAIEKHPNASCVQTLKTDIEHIHEYDNREVELFQFGKFDCHSGNVFGLPTGVAYNKQLLLEIGGIPHDKYQIYGFWTHLLCLYQGPFYCIKKTLCAYRVSEANDSNNTELQQTWICYDYWLLKNLYKKFLIPKFIYEPFLSSHADGLYYGIRKKWKSEFEFPHEYVSMRKFPHWRYVVSNKSLLLVEKIVRRFTIAS